MAKTDTAHSIEEAQELADAYGVHAGALKRLRKMLATPGDHFAQQHEDRVANDAAVLSVVDDLVPLAEQTARWLGWAAREIRRQEEQAHEGDEVSLKAALNAIEALRAPARHLADQAVTVLDVVQRAALGRQMVSESADDVWWPHAEEDRAQTRGQRASYTPLGEFVEQQLAVFRSHPEFTKVPQWLLKARSLRKKPIQRRWLALYRPMLAIEANAEEIDSTHQRLQRDYQQVLGTRHRAQAEARREKSEREKKAAADREALEARRLADHAKDLTGRAQAHRGNWDITSRQLRERGWTGLLKQLCDGIRIRDDKGNDVLVVAGIPRDLGGQVLALLQLAADHGDKTAERLGDLLATEDELLHDRARLHAAAARLSAEARAGIGLPDLHPDLRGAYEWLAEHMDEVSSALSAHAPEAASTLRDAVGRMQRTKGRA